MSYCHSYRSLRFSEAGIKKNTKGHWSCRDTADRAGGSPLATRQRLSGKFEPQRRTLLQQDPMAATPGPGVRHQEEPLVRMKYQPQPVVAIGILPTRRKLLSAHLRR